MVDAAPYKHRDAGSIPALPNARQGLAGEASATRLVASRPFSGLALNARLREWRVSGTGL